MRELRCYQYTDGIIVLTVGTYRSIETTERDSVLTRLSYNNVFILEFKNIFIYTITFLLFHYTLLLT